MNCRQAERLMVRAKDWTLTGPEKDSLEAHLRGCARCREVNEQYRSLFQALQPAEPPHPGAFLWERLRARIEGAEAAAKPQYERWALKVIPAAVALALLIGSASLLFQPSASSPASPTEELLLRNTNPLVEAQTILEQKKLEEKGLMLIFASSEGSPSERR